MSVNERHTANIMSCLDRFDQAARGCTFTAEEGSQILNRMRQSATEVFRNITPGAPVVDYMPEELKQPEPKQLEGIVQESNGKTTDRSE